MSRPISRAKNTSKTHSDRVTLTLSGEQLRLAVVADTHSSPHVQLTTHLAALRPDAILHAGDIGDERVLRVLGDIAQVVAVRGNIDPVGKPDVTTISMVDAEGELLRVLLLHIGLAGPRLRADAARSAVQHGAHLVVCGHSHVPFIGRDRGLLVLNPGSAGPPRPPLPIVFAWLELSRRGLSMYHVDCQTGARWEPALGPRARTTEAANR